MAEAIVVLVPAPDFKSGGGRGDTSSAGSIPVRFRQTQFGFHPLFEFVHLPTVCPGDAERVSSRLNFRAQGPQR